MPSRTVRAKHKGASITVIVPRETAAALQRIGLAEQRSKSNLARFAIVRFIDDWERQHPTLPLAQ